MGIPLAAVPPSEVGGFSFEISLFLSHILWVFRLIQHMPNPPDKQPFHFSLLCIILGEKYEPKHTTDLMPGRGTTQTLFLMDSVSTAESYVSE